MHAPKEVSLLGCKPQSSPIDTKTTFGIHFLVGKLINFIVTHSNIAYTIDLLRQFMHAPQEIHYRAKPMAPYIFDAFSRPWSPLLTT